ncbi:hypothetical protein O181_106957 [Austropuccinia psidii MF-1]|uniref:Putative nuclease HARBI1 n=1 Tax=Austropuccinia psidii MF-1 TaxID=1389203 RepID=A0A9Q3JT23_9BASI|nr:hypothetical protein [Austropuccinia psidii MF-1]
MISMPYIPTFGNILYQGSRVKDLMFEWVLSEDDNIVDEYNWVLTTRYLNGHFRGPSKDEYSINSLFQDNDADFKQSVRTSKTGFAFIYELIKKDKFFENKSYCNQLDLCHQLAITLEHLGSNGNGASVGHFARKFSVSHGMIIKVTRHVIHALYSIGPQYLEWPNQEGHKHISLVLAKEGFPGCVGFIDGTSFPLYQKPGQDGKVFFDRKKRYSLNAQIVCDVNKRITAILTGWPGSCADSAVYQRMELFNHAKDFFLEDEYLLADLAYPLGEHCIPCYKAPATQDANNQQFNFWISHSRVRVEHCIGILKGRWASLAGLQFLFYKSANLEHMVRWIYVCAVLHNILADLGDSWDDLLEEPDSLSITNAQNAPAGSVAQQLL